MMANDSLRDKLGLPSLSRAELEQLARGQRVQKQTRQGFTGSGLVVVDVDADISTVFQDLSSFDRYDPDHIVPTVPNSPPHDQVRGDDSHRQVRQTLQQK